MLVQFTLKNVLSFKDETVFDMRAVNSYKEHPDHLISNGGKERLLKVAAIYGANASGKSNLYIAMQSYGIIIRQSMNTTEDRESAISKYYAPFEFDGNKDDSMLEAVIEHEGHQYTYGFQYNGESITGEWAYSRSLETGRQSILLERDSNEIVFGATARRDCNAYSDQIPNETLALTFLSRLKRKNVFHDVLNAIEGLIVVPLDILDSYDFLERILPRVIDKEKNQLTRFLSALDTGIKDIRCVEDGKETIFLTTHFGEDGEEYELNLLNESAGTIRCILIYINVSMAMRRGGTLVIDELNLRLHPLMLKYITNLFYNEETNAQLIYTTHDVTLLRKEFFRRDQIWVVDKDQYGHSSLAALSDYKRRADASFDKEYLGGVYGGIPHFTPFSFDEE